MLSEINRNLFLWINQDGGHHYAWLDGLMLVLSDPRSAIAVLAPLIIYIFWRERKGAYAIFAGLVLMLLLSDGTGAILKHWFLAERPCKTLEGVRLLADYCGRNSFPSNHSLNMAAFAVYVGAHYRALALPMAALAIMVGISRVYVGVHYPGDVLAGWGIGIVFGLAFVWGYRRAWLVIKARMGNTAQGS